MMQLYTASEDDQLAWVAALAHDTLYGYVAKALDPGEVLSMAAGFNP